MFSPVCEYRYKEDSKIDQLRDCKINKRELTERRVYFFRIRYNVVLARFRTNR
jgi:hypothetical protein